jgi:hypothetical protein
MEKYTTVTQHLGQGYPNCDPPGLVMRPAPTFLNYVRTVKIAQQLSRLNVPLTVTFTRAALYDGRCPLPPKNLDTSRSGTQKLLQHSVMCQLTETPQ